MNKVFFLFATFLTISFQSPTFADGQKNYANCWESNLDEGGTAYYGMENIDGNYTCMKNSSSGDRGWCRLNNTSCNGNTNYTHEGNCKEDDPIFGDDGNLTTDRLGEKYTYSESACAYRKDEDGSENYAGCANNTVYGAYTCRKDPSDQLGWCENDDTTCNTFERSSACDKTNPIFTDGKYSDLWALRENYCSYNSNGDKNPPCYIGNGTVDCSDEVDDQLWDTEDNQTLCQSYYDVYETKQCKWEVNKIGIGSCETSGFDCQI